MILILDFGSQYTQLIARRVREARVYCEIHPYNLAPERIRAMAPKGIILRAARPASMSMTRPISARSPRLGMPVLGICYGMYVIAQHLGARSAGSARREYGPAILTVDEPDALFEGLAGGEHLVWMSHGDRAEEFPRGLCAIAHSENSPYAAVRSPDGRLRGIQFHPEVVHTPEGTTILRNFVHISAASGATGRWRVSWRPRSPRFASRPARTIGL